MVSTEVQGEEDQGGCREEGRLLDKPEGEEVAEETRKGTVDALAEKEASDESESPAQDAQQQLVTFNLSFAKRLQLLEYRASQIQGTLACLSTLGGAYHLCNKPKTALLIARKQELVGRSLGSSPIVVRAKTFQAANWRALGRRSKSKKCVEECRELIANLRSRNHPSAGELEKFLSSFEAWMDRSYCSDRVEELPS